MRILKTINDWLFRIIGIMGALCLFAMVVLVFAQAGGRYVFGYAIKWSSELTVYLMTLSVYLGCTMGYRSNSIISLTILTDKLPKIWQDIAKIIVTLILMFFFVVTFKSNLATVANAAMRKSSIMRLNLGLISGIWNVASAIMFLFGVEKLIPHIQELIYDIKNKGKKIDKSEEVSA